MPTTTVDDHIGVSTLALNFEHEDEIKPILEKLKSYPDTVVDPITVDHAFAYTEDFLKMKTIGEMVYHVLDEMQNAGCYLTRQQTDDTQNTTLEHLDDLASLAPRIKEINNIAKLFYDKGMIVYTDDVCNYRSNIELLADNYDKVFRLISGLPLSERKEYPIFQNASAIVELAESADKVHEMIDGAKIINPLDLIANAGLLIGLLKSSDPKQTAENIQLYAKSLECIDM